MTATRLTLNHKPFFPLSNPPINPAGSVPRGARRRAALRGQVLRQHETGPPPEELVRVAQLARVGPVGGAALGHGSGRGERSRSRRQQREGCQGERAEDGFVGRLASGAAVGEIVYYFSFICLHQRMFAFVSEFANSCR